MVLRRDHARIASNRKREYRDSSRTVKNSPMTPNGAIAVTHWMEL